MLIWRYDTTTGYWRFQRECSPENVNAYLDIYRRDDPKTPFRADRAEGGR